MRARKLPMLSSLTWRNNAYSEWIPAQQTAGMTGKRAVTKTSSPNAVIGPSSPNAVIGPSSPNAVIGDPSGLPAPHEQ